MPGDCAIAPAARMWGARRCVELSARGVHDGAVRVDGTRRTASLLAAPCLRSRTIAQFASCHHFVPSAPCSRARGASLRRDLGTLFRGSWRAICFNLRAPKSVPRSVFFREQSVGARTASFTARHTAVHSASTACRPGSTWRWSRTRPVHCPWPAQYCATHLPHPRAHCSVTRSCRTAQMAAAGAAGCAVCERT